MFVYWSSSIGIFRSERNSKSFLPHFEFFKSSITDLSFNFDDGDFWWIKEILMTFVYQFYSFEWDYIFTVKWKLYFSRSRLCILTCGRGGSNNNVFINVTQWSKFDSVTRSCTVEFVITERSVEVYKRKWEEKAAVANMQSTIKVSKISRIVSTLSHKIVKKSLQYQVEPLSDNLISS